MFGFSGLSNYPPGVTGNEFEINGPDFEEEFPEKECPNGHIGCTKVGYNRETWFYCWNEECSYYQGDGFEQSYDEEPEPYVPDYMDEE